jgi:hypothetical protein
MNISKFIHIYSFFTQIRIEVSDQLFTQLSVSEEDYSEAMDIITGTDWYIFKVSKTNPC